MPAARMAKPKPEEETAKKQQSCGCNSKRTLYFIRHGEALHNILEKEARQKAKEAAIAEGYDPDSEETLRRMEEARMAVLNDESLLDAPLSDMGEKDAEEARACIETLINAKGFPPPTEVLVSPLVRALQTAKIVFPDHGNIRVREEVRERITGKACDSSMPISDLRRRNTFKDFSMNRMVMMSRRKTLRDSLLRYMAKFGRGKSKGQTDSLAEEPKQEVEDKYRLRERTRKLFDLIAGSRHEVLAVVTHKGFLRELERGPFGITDATEFGNGEVRVYRACFKGKSTELEFAERVA